MILVAVWGMNSRQTSESESGDTKEVAITVTQIRDGGGLPPEANGGSGRKWAELRCAVAMELKGLTEEFKMRNVNPHGVDKLIAHLLSLYKNSF